MSEPAGRGAPISLRQAVRDATGYDVRRCGHCSYCVHFVTPDDDLSLEALIQLIMMNDEEVLTSRTLWSDEALKRARLMCVSTMDVAAIMLALRDEARRRGLSKDEG
jgi:heterodisulfide reductase subunit C